VRARPPGRPWVVATDLDGTLLDPTTYGFEPARPTLSRLAEAGALLVLASSKTRPEMVELAARIGAVAALAAENGGEILLPRAGAWRSVALGTPRVDLVAALADMSRETGIATRGFAGATVDEVTSWTGLDASTAALAMDRSFDEPFVVTAGDSAVAAAALASAAGRRGLVVSRGGRFLHLHGPVDKGNALVRLLAELAPDGPRPWVVALGDAANDLSMLLLADRAVILPRPDGRFDPVLAAALPEAMRAPVAGPVGWSAAMRAILDEAEAGERAPEREA
jgi:mannosyl-3-phosphoglycerate phosphatase